MGKLSENWILLTISLIVYGSTVISFTWKLGDNHKHLSARNTKIKELESRVEELEKLVKNKE